MRARRTPPQSRDPLATRSGHTPARHRMDLLDMSCRKIDRGVQTYPEAHCPSNHGSSVRDSASGRIWRWCHPLFYHARLRVAFAGATRGRNGNHLCRTGHLGFIDGTSHCGTSFHPTHVKAQASHDQTPICKRSQPERNASPDKLGNDRQGRPGEPVIFFCDTPRCYAIRGGRHIARARHARLRKMMPLSANNRSARSTDPHRSCAHKPQMCGFRCRCGELPVQDVRSQQAQFPLASRARAFRARDGAGCPNLPEHPPPAIYSAALRLVRPRARATPSP